MSVHERARSLIITRLKDVPTDHSTRLFLYELLSTLDVEDTTSNFDDVGDFHEKFNLDNVTHRGPGRRALNSDLVSYRIKFLREELQEFEDACDVRDEAKMFDALIDLAYVAHGTAHMFGYPWQDGWNAVQRANMSKVRGALDGSDSPRQSAWDVVKPPGWTPPDLTEVLTRHGFVADRTRCPRCGRRLDDMGFVAPEIRCDGAWDGCGLPDLNA